MIATTTTTTTYHHVTHGQELAIQAVFLTLSLLHAPFIPAFLGVIAHMIYTNARAAKKRSTRIAHKIGLFLMPVAAEVFLLVRLAYYLLVAGRSFAATAAGEVRINGPELSVPPAGTLLWGIANVVEVLLFFTQVMLWIQIYSEAKNMRRESSRKFNILSGVCSGIIFGIVVGGYILTGLYHELIFTIVMNILMVVLLVGVNIGTIVSGVLLLSRLRPKANSATPNAHQELLYRSFVRFSILIFGVAVCFLVLIALLIVWTALYPHVTSFTFLIGSHICVFIVEWLIALTLLIFLLLAVYEQRLQSSRKQNKKKTKDNQQQEQQQQQNKQNLQKQKNNRGGGGGLPAATDTTQTVQQGGDNPNNDDDDGEGPDNHTMLHGYPTEDQATTDATLTSTMFVIASDDNITPQQR